MLVAPTRLERSDMIEAGSEVAGEWETASQELDRRHPWICQASRCGRGPDVRGNLWWVVAQGSLPRAHFEGQLESLPTYALLRMLRMTIEVRGMVGAQADTRRS